MPCSFISERPFLFLILFLKDLRALR